MIKTILPERVEPISINPTNDEIMETHFENIFKRLRKIDITLECILDDIIKNKKETNHD